MYSDYVLLGIEGLIPVIATAVIAFVMRNSKKRHLPEWAQQLVIGLIFGILAIFATEFGFPSDGAQINCRDAAAVTAGLVFGFPAGVIAGVIGGVERWIAASWGVGVYTKVACSISTIIAGVGAGLFRKFMFDDKHPSWVLALSHGIVIEVFHLSMVFLTHISDSVKAMQIIKAWALPIIIANGLSVMFAVIAYSIVNREHISRRGEKRTITEIMQRSMILCLIAVFITLSLFTVKLQQSLSENQTNTVIDGALTDLREFVNEKVDKNLLDTTRSIQTSIEKGEALEAIMKEKGIAEISQVDKLGVIFASTNPNFVGFDMKDSEQSIEFMCLLDGSETEYSQAYGPIALDQNVYRKYAGIKTDYGFLQVGYSAAEFQADIEDELETLVQNRHVGNAGYVAVVDKNGRIVAAKDMFIAAAVAEWVVDYEIAGLPEMNKVFETTVRDTDMYAKIADVEGLNVVAFYPVAEANQSRDVALYANGFMYILLFAVMFILVFNLIKILIVYQLRNVGASLGEITNGNLEVVVNARNCAEFDRLSNDINSTVDTMKGFIAEASARIDADLATAKTIQESVLPVVYSRRKEYDAYARMDTAKEVGGDFYDFYHTHKDTVNLLIADVSGKGIPAAMFMMRGKTELKSLTETDIPVNEVFERSNGTLCEGNGNGMFITTWQGQIDLKTGHVFFANAGHNPPLIMHAGGDFQYLHSKVNLVLAGMDGVPYRLQELTLGRGDILFLYTDGVTEATDVNNELYGEDRLLACLNANKGATVKELCDRVKDDVDVFVKGAPQFDDITMLAFKFNGKPESPKIAFEEAKIEDVPLITDFIEEKLMNMGCPRKTIIAMNIAVDEIYSNIVNHGYANKKGPASVIVNELNNPHGVEVCFVDKAVPYNPINSEDPDTSLSAEERGIGGLGIFMVKKSMDDMSYEYKDGRNILKIRKNF